MSLEDRNDDHDLELFRQRLHSLGSWPGNRLSQIEPVGLLRFAEIGRIKELLEADYLSAAAGSFAYPRDCLLQSQGCIGRNRFLNEAEQ